MQTGHCSRCRQLRTTDQLNGYNPLTGDFSNAYCRRLADCNSQEAQAMADELLSELDPLPQIEVDELPVSAALESLDSIDRCDRTPPGALIQRRVTLNLTVVVGGVELDVAHIPDLMVGDLIDLYLQVSHRGSAGLTSLPPRFAAPQLPQDEPTAAEGQKPRMRRSRTAGLSQEAAKQLVSHLYPDRRGRSCEAPRSGASLPAATEGRGEMSTAHPGRSTTLRCELVAPLPDSESEQTAHLELQITVPPVRGHDLRP